MPAPFSFGKYAGVDLANIPDDYLEWMIRDSRTKLDICVNELTRRRTIIDESYMMKIIKTGLAALKTGIEQLDHNKLDKAYKALESAIEDAAKPKGSTP